MKFPEGKRSGWFGVWVEQLQACYGMSGAESAAHEARLEARMRALRERFPNHCLAVDERGWSLMHLAARRAKTEGLVRCVWECCGERALLLMRQTTAVLGCTVLQLLAENPNMTRGMYAVFAEHCTDDDLCAADDNGWTVLFIMAHTFIHHAKTEEQEENVASVMCAVVQRLGPGALLAESGCSGTPSSVLHKKGEKSRVLLQRLEAAAALGECAKSEQDAGGSVPEHEQSAAAPAPTAMLPASAPAPSAPVSGATTDVDNSTARVV